MKRKKKVAKVKSRHGDKPDPLTSQAVTPVDGKFLRMLQTKDQRDGTSIRL